MGGRRAGDRDAAGDGGGGAAGRENSNSKPVAVRRVPLYRLFAFADRTDALLMGVGAIAAVANGMAQPVMTFIFGQVIDAFGSSASHDDMLHRVVKVPPFIHTVASSSINFSFFISLSFSFLPLYQRQHRVVRYLRGKVDRNFILFFISR